MTRLLRRTLCAAAAWLAISGLVRTQEAPAAGQVELIRDRWGIPHLFASRETDVFFGLGWASAEDRLLQMELFRRRARGRLAEVFGARWVETDRRFRIAGVGQYTAEAVGRLPEDLREYLRAYAAGVNAFVAAQPDRAARRLSPLGVAWEPWTPADSIAAWMAVAEVFDRLYDESAVAQYRDFERLVSEVGEVEALRQRVMVIDDAAAVVAEGEMARDAALYSRLKAMPPTPGWLMRSHPDESIRLSHAWAVDGSRSTTGKPILESDPQTSVNNPPLWYEFHLSAGTYDARGIGVAGCPAMLVGWNRRIAWGATALGAGSTLTFLERLGADNVSYFWSGERVPFERRVERIDVKGGEPLLQEVLTGRHGFVFNSLVRSVPPGEAYVSHVAQIQDGATSAEAMMQWMRAASWSDFRASMGAWYSPGLHVVFADVDGNLGYQTLVRLGRTRRTPRMALEGWTGQDEVGGRIPLEEMPYLFNPRAGFISHANNLPVGSWYPHDLGISTGGVGHTARSLRLVQLLEPRSRWSPNDFESLLHRDDTHAAVAALLPAARRVAAEDAPSEAAVTGILEATRDWDLRFRSSQPTYRYALALAGALLPAYRRAGLNEMLGGGEGGITHLARLVAARGDETPQTTRVREYLVNWLRTAFDMARTGGPEVHAMPYQQNGPLGFPSLDPAADLVSPPLECGEVSTIWSQKGNSYTQIVDLADIENSRSMLPPGISEDPESPFHADQVPLWVAGTTHPAPLSRARVVELSSSRVLLQSQPYEGVDSPPPRLAKAADAGRRQAALR